MSDSMDPSERPGIVEDTARAARAEASQAWHEARREARDKVEQGKDAAAQGIEQVADALHQGARRSQGDSDTVARLADMTADGLERVSSALRRNDVGSMLRSVESFSRQQPMAFFGIALATGFLAARAMRSHGPQR